MLICQNAEKVHGQRKVENPCTRPTDRIVIISFSQSTLVLMCLSLTSES